MAYIGALKGVRFNPDKVGKLDEVVTPPYDVINETAVQSFLAKNPYSMIQLDITKTPGGSNENESRYSNAAGLFNQWLDEDVLVRDSQDTIYLYETRYNHPSGRQLIRKGLVCLVGLAEFSEGIVRPHEKIFPTVIKDRLKLTEHCKAQFSQVFSFYSDPANYVIDQLENFKGEQLASVTDADGCVHSIFPVTDKKSIEKVQKFFLDHSIYIADGHHRYTTALAYRNKKRDDDNSFKDKSPANHIMMYICPMEDSGLSVLPTHRLLNWPGTLTCGELIERLTPGFEIQEISDGTRETLLERVLSRMDEIDQQDTDKSSSTFGVYHPSEDRCFLLSLKENSAEMLVGVEDVMRTLDVFILSELIMKNLFGLDSKRCEQENLIRYFSDPDEALDTAVKESADDSGYTQLLFLMNPTRVVQVKNVADQDLIMPHKSTYFYPKIMTGLIFNKLVDEEEINRID